MDSEPAILLAKFGFTDQTSTAYANGGDTPPLKSPQEMGVEDGAEYPELWRFVIGRYMHLPLITSYYSDL